MYTYVYVYLSLSLYIYIYQILSNSSQALLQGPRRLRGHGRDLGLGARAQDPGRHAELRTGVGEHDGAGGVDEQHERESDARTDAQAENLARAVRNSCCEARYGGGGRSTERSGGAEERAVTVTSTGGDAAPRKFRASAETTCATPSARRTPGIATCAGER